MEKKKNPSLDSVDPGNTCHFTPGVYNHISGRNHFYQQFF